jgi:predicted nucleic acid-binding protein
MVEGGAVIPYGPVVLPTGAALFLAAKAYRLYRRRGGTRTGVLPDFFIGAHASVLDCVLLTRNPWQYRHYSRHYA